MTHEQVREFINVVNLAYVSAANGIMEERGCSVEEAFTLLRDLFQFVTMDTEFVQTNEEVEVALYHAELASAIGTMVIGPRTFLEGLG